MGASISRFHALLLLLALACGRDRSPSPRDSLPTLDSVPAESLVTDTLPSALDSLLDTLPVISVETLVTPVPTVDTSVIIVPETTVVVDTTIQPDTTIIAVIDSTPKGIPFGPFGAVEPPFTLRVGATSPGRIVEDLETARREGYKLLIKLVGGAHDRYLTDFGRGKEFDRSKWSAELRAYNRPEIKRAIAEAVKDGTLIGNDVMDEPNVSGGQGSNTWGPRGTMTKARVDSLCAESKSYFPSLPVGVSHDHTVFWPDSSYKVCEFIIPQYAYRKGSLTAWRDAALAMGQRDGHGVLFSLNILKGGTMIEGCPVPTTGGQSDTPRYCKMTPQQLRTVALALAPKTCGALLMWKHDSGFMRDSANRAVFQEIAQELARRPSKPCRRS